MRNLKLKLEYLQRELLALKINGNNSIKNNHKALLIIKNLKFDNEREILSSGFKSQEEEIFFYKVFQPQLNGLLIFYKVKSRIELMQSNCTDVELKSLIVNNIQHVKQQFENQPEFVTYLNSGDTARDMHYFTANANSFNSFSLTPDQQCSNGYDLIAAYVYAHRLLLEEFNLAANCSWSKASSSNLNWTMDKVAFVELISGLYTLNVINGGNIELKTIAYELSKVFQIDVKDIYGKRKEIKARKGERFKFLKQMISALENEFEDDF